MENEATRPQPSGCATPEGTASSGQSPVDTRRRVAELLLQNGQATARQLAAAIGITHVAVRKHLDAMATDGLVEFREPLAKATGRGRGRPARTYRLAPAARDTFGHHYDDLATQALRWIHQHGGPAAVTAFAGDQVSALEERCRTALADAGDDTLARATALAEALSAEGYAATAKSIANGGQLCQHHCPVAHAAAEFPQLCEAETEVISRLVGHHVQRLATIANGDGVCTTYIPGVSGAGLKSTTAIETPQVRNR